MPIISGGGGGGGPAAGTYVPVAIAGGATVDDTTYTNPLTGTGKLTTLVFPPNAALMSVALSGDAFPRMVYFADPNNGGIVAFGDGTYDPYNDGGQISLLNGGGVQIAGHGLSGIYFGGYPVIEFTSAPADSILFPGGAALWFDDTNGASKLMVKAQSANGTVVTGSVNLA